MQIEITTLGVFSSPLQTMLILFFITKICTLHQIHDNFKSFTDEETYKDYIKIFTEFYSTGFLPLVKL